MLKSARSIFDIREGEYKITFLMLANIYLILLTFYFLKPARDSLFLVELGADQLPYVFILTALIVIPITTLYSKASRILKLNRLIIYTNAALIFCLFILRYLMIHPNDWVPYLFYSWVSIYGALTTSQFWLLANHIYTATQAKRLFSLLGLGAIFGAFSGGEITNIMVDYMNVSTEDLLLFCAGFVFFSILLIKLIWNSKKTEIELQHRQLKKEPQRKESLWTIFESIKTSKHLMLIVGILSITMIVGSLIDFQFKAISTESFTDTTTGIVNKSELTAFLGTFYGRLSLASIFIQMFIAGKVIKKFGVGTIILLLPIGLLLGSVAFFAYTSLISAVLLRGTDGALKNSIDKTGRELLFLPVTPELKKRTKLFIDLFVDRVARGLAGFLLLLLIAVFHYDEDPVSAMQSISLVIGLFVTVWLILAFLMRVEYVNTFRQAIENRELNLSEIRQQINESSTINILITSLQSSNQREIIYALDMLEGIKNESLIDPLNKLLQHNSDEIVIKTLKLLKHNYEEIEITNIKSFVDSPNPQIRIQALHILMLKESDRSDELVQSYLTHENVEHRITAICMLSEIGTNKQTALINDVMISNIITFSEDNQENLKLLVRALGQLQNPEYSKYVGRMLDHPSDEIGNEAIKAIRKLKDLEFTNWLIKALADSRYRVEARKTLASFGTLILYRLNEQLNDFTTSWQIKIQLPKTMSLIHDQMSIDILTASLSHTVENLKFHIIKALSKLRVNCPDLNFYQKKIDQFIISEIKMYYQYEQILSVIAQNSDDEKLLHKSIEESQNLKIEQIFRLLGLYLNPTDIYNAYQAVVSKDKNRQSSAVELLDNILSRELKKYLLPIFDEQDRDKIVNTGRELYKLKRLSSEGALLLLVDGKDIWLKSLATYVARNQQTDKITKSVQKLQNYKITVVNEAVELYLNTADR